MEGAPQTMGARAASFHDPGYMFSQQQQGQHAGNDPQRRNLMNQSSMSSSYDNQGGSYSDSAHMGQQGRWSQRWSGASAHGSGASMGPISVPAGAVPAGFTQFDPSSGSPPIPALLPNYSQSQQVSPRPAASGPAPPGLPGPLAVAGHGGPYGGPSGGAGAAGGGHEHMHAYGNSGEDALGMQHSAGSAGALSAQQLAGALRVGATKEDRLGLSRREFKRLLRAEVQAGMPIDPSYAHHPHDQASASPRMMGPGVGAGLRVGSASSPMGGGSGLSPMGGPGPDARARLHLPLGNVQQQHPGIASAQSSGRSSGSGSPHDLPLGPYGSMSGPPSHLHQSWGSAPNTARGGGPEQQGQCTGQQHYGSFYGQGPAQGGGVNWSAPAPTPVSKPAYARPSPKDSPSEAITASDGGSKSTSGYGALLSRNGQDVPSASFAPTARAIDSQKASSLSRLGLHPAEPPQTQAGRMPDASMAGAYAAAAAKGSGDTLQSVRHLLPSSLMNLDGDSIAPAPAFGTGYLSLSSTGGTSPQQGFLVLDKLPGSLQLGIGSASMPVPDSLARVQSTDSGWNRLSSAADGSDVSTTVAYKASGGEENGGSARTDGVTGQVSLTSRSSDSNASAGAPASAPGTGDSGQDKSLLNSVPTSTRGLSLPDGSHHGVSSAVSSSSDNSGNSSDKERARLVATLSSSEEGSSGSGRGDGGDGRKSTAPPSPTVENPSPEHAQEVVATGSGSDYSVAALQGGLLASMSAEGQLAVVRATLHDMVERETRDLRRKLAESDAAHEETKSVLQFVVTKLEMAVTRIKQLESKAVQLAETSAAADATVQAQA